MSRETFVYRNGELVPRHLAAPLNRSDSAPMIMGDLAPYRSAAADKGTGKREIIGGRRQHREFLARNGYTEVGNERMAIRKEELQRGDRVSDIKRAFGE